MATDPTIWSDTPAPMRRLDHGSPLGNGRIGAMVHGCVYKERITINEDTLWARDSGNDAAINPDAKQALPRVRELLMQDNPTEAEFVAEHAMMGLPGRLQPYQLLADLYIIHKNLRGQSPDTYKRTLNLATATSDVQFTAADQTIQRTAFVSAVDQCFVMRISAQQPAGVNALLLFERPVDARTQIIDGPRLLYTGRCGCEGTRFVAAIDVQCQGGTVENKGGRLAIVDADEAVIRLTVGTDFRGRDPEEIALSHLDSAMALDFDQLHERHVAEHRPLFERCQLELPEDRELAALPTNKRIERVKEHGRDDPGLAALLFAFGRYLLIASSRPGCLPANLQGIWNDSVVPPWQADYHTNINIQMNYWPAAVTNLAECELPLFDWLESTIPNGRRMAREHYDCAGYVLHHISNPWGYAAPGGPVTCGLWPMGGAWCALHFAEHARMTGDRKFLANRALPFMKLNAEFFFDFLIEGPEGTLLCGPSNSPENAYRLPDGRFGNLAMGCTMDNMILRELFDAIVEASQLLDTEHDLADHCRAVRERLPKTTVGTHGQIMEWATDYDEVEPGHRHISPLFGLHPGRQIAPSITPELVAAARKTIERRLEHGGGHTGWSAAWLSMMYARLHDGENAGKVLNKLLKASSLPSLLLTHPPFQIDASFGITAAIAEMIVQSHVGDEPMLLPALPPSWTHGKLLGVRLRGGDVADIEWVDGKVTRFDRRPTADQ